MIREVAECIVCETAVASAKRGFCQLHSRVVREVEADFALGACHLAALARAAAAFRCFLAIAEVNGRTSDI